MIVPDGFAHVRLIWSLTNDPEEMISTFGLENQANLGAEALAEYVYDCYTASFDAADLSSSYTFEGVSVTLGPQPGDGPTGEFRNPVPGTSAQLRPPSNLAVLVRKVTALGGRRNRGRMFLPAGFVAEGNVDERGFLAAPLVAAIQADMDEFYEALTQGALDYVIPVILHAEAPATPTQITSFSVQTLSATQRRRMRR